jgi:hypothetical protein
MQSEKLTATNQNIWSKITIEQFVESIASSGDRSAMLKEETWRLHINTSAPSSLWTEVINMLGLEQNERTRHSLYKLWNMDRRSLRQLVEKRKKMLRKKHEDECDGIDESDKASAPIERTSVLVAKTSLPLPSRPNTRSEQSAATNGCAISHLRSGRLHSVELIKQGNLAGVTYLPRNLHLSVSHVLCRSRLPS